MTPTPAPLPPPSDGPLPAPALDAQDPDYVVTVDLLGDTFTLPASPDDWPFSAMKSFEQGQVVGFVEMLLGDQVDRFWKLDPTTKQAGEFTEAYFERIGFNNAGN